MIALYLKKKKINSQIGMIKYVSEVTENCKWL